MKARPEIKLLKNKSEMKNGSIPKVSVCIVTYNHAKYIRQAILSVVDQQADFPFEVIVGDDASNDGTTEIVQEMASQYPFIKTLIQPSNVGGSHNYFAVNKAAKGEYVAYTDGDDYWLPGKMQKQADFLDTHPNFSAVGTKYLSLDQEGFLKKTLQQNILIHKNNVLTSHNLPKLSSLMLRSSSRTILTLEPKELGNDWMFYLDLALWGPIKILEEFLTVYRVGVGVSSDPAKRKFILNSFENLFDYAISLGYNKEIVERRRSSIYCGYAMDALGAKHFTEFERLSRLSVSRSPMMTLRQRLMFALRNTPRIAYTVLQSGRLLKRCLPSHIVRMIMGHP